MSTDPLNWVPIYDDPQDRILALVGFGVDDQGRERVFAVQALYDDRDANFDGVVSTSEALASWAAPVPLKGRVLTEAVLRFSQDPDLAVRDPDFAANANRQLSDFAGGLVFEGVEAVYIRPLFGELVEPLVGRAVFGLTNNFLGQLLLTEIGKNVVLDAIATAGGVVAEAVVDAVPLPMPTFTDLNFLLTGAVADPETANDVLQLNYRGFGAGQTAQRVSLSQLAGADFEYLRVTLADGTTTPTQTLRGFERYDITGSSGNDDLDGDEGADILRGGPGNDRLNGYGGGDVLLGGGGDDVYGLTTGNGDADQLGDHIDGGEGWDRIDRLTLSSVATPIDLTLGSGLNLLLPDSTTILSIEDIRETRLGSADDIFNAGFFVGNTVFGNGGSDTLLLDYSGTDASGRTATGVTLGQVANVDYDRLRVTLSDGSITSTANLYSIERYDVIGSPGDDSLDGGVGSDVLRGGPGNDRLNGYGGGDVLLGGGGDDVYGLTTGNGDADQLGDHIDGGEGWDRIDRLTLSSVATPIDLTLGSGLNLLLPDSTTILSIEDIRETRLGSADDIFNAGFFVGNTVFGNGGSDTLLLDYSGTDASGRTATGVTLGQVANVDYDRLRVTLSDGSITSTANLYSIERYDVIGSPGDDSLDGGVGSDVLRGGPGNDRLNGYGGLDTYVFSPGWGTDTVTDGDPEGRLVFVDIDQNELSFQNIDGHLEIAVGSDTIVFSNYFVESKNYEILYSTSEATLSFDLNPVRQIVHEDAGTTMLTIGRPTADSAASVYVTVRSNGLNLADQDFGDPDNIGVHRGISGKAVSFTTGAITASFGIAINNDAVPERNEQFWIFVHESSVLRPSEVLAAGSITIVDDDTAQRDLATVYGSFLDASVELARFAYDDDTNAAEAAGWAPVNNGIHSVTPSLAAERSVLHAYAADLDGTRTLAIAFRGTDNTLELATQIARWDEYYEAHQPFVRQLLDWGRENGIEQVLVTGHSLGGILVEQMAATDGDFSGLARDAYYVTFGSPGSTANGTGRKLVNFVHTGDIVARFDGPPLGREGTTVWIDRPEAFGRSLLEHELYLYRASVLDLQRDYKASPLGSGAAALDYWFEGAEGRHLAGHASSGRALVENVGNAVDETVVMPVTDAFGFTIVGSFELLDGIKLNEFSTLDGFELIGATVGEISASLSDGSLIVEVADQGGSDARAILTIEGDFGGRLSIDPGDAGARFTFQRGPGPDILGTEEGDQLAGTPGSDVIRAGDGADVVVARQGDDIIDGGPGDDVLSGGSGDDVFIKRPGESDDTITDFTSGASADGGDKLDVSAYGLTFGQIEFEPEAGGLRVRLAADSILLEAVVLGALDESDFLGLVTDSDGDLVPDNADNAIFVANPDQRDSNGDGYGNVIDADLTNDGVIDVEDLLIFRRDFGSTRFQDGVDAAADADFDGDGAVDVDDLLTFRELFGQPLGASFVDDQMI